MRASGDYETFGSFMAELRRELGQSLREFCTANGFDPGNLSKLERGRLGPPKSRDVLERYALALGVEEESDDWYRFFDLASTERGEIPGDLLNDEEIMGQLPVLFRTLRGESVPEEEIDGLIERIRRA